MSSATIIMDSPAEVVAADLEKMSRTMTDLTPVWTRAMPLVEREVREAFASHGESIGRAWPALEPNYARRMGRAEATLIDTGALLTAATTGAKRIIQPRWAKYRVNFLYAGIMQFGGRLKRRVQLSEANLARRKGRKSKKKYYLRSVGERKIPGRAFLDVFTSDFPRKILDEVFAHVDKAATTFEQAGGGRASGAL